MEAVYISYMILEILFAEVFATESVENDFIMIAVYLLYDS